MLSSKGDYANDGPMIGKQRKGGSRGPRLWREGEAPPANMTLVPGGVFSMGSENFYPEERPLRQVRVDRFWMDAAPVTNSDFGRFVDDTGYVTEAEIPPDPERYPLMLEGMGAAGSLVFHQTRTPVDLSDPGQWWSFEIGADWRHPEGPNTDIAKLADHPVVHVSYTDALAYANWAGKALPTEAEWECAAWGGSSDQDYVWGSELMPGGRVMANTWHGLFPFANQSPHGWTRTSAVGAFPPNEWGLFDMIGNVWEWTSDWYSAGKSSPERQGPSCCIPSNPRGARRADSLDPSSPLVAIPRRVVKGGSHLCAPSYCQRYRPPARQPQAVDTSTSHIGFRCIIRIADPKAG
jgi:formylglycine-generating enzyme